MDGVSVLLSKRWIVLASLPPITSGKAPCVIATGINGGDIVAQVASSAVETDVEISTGKINKKVHSNANVMITSPSAVFIDICHMGATCYVGIKYDQKYGQNILVPYGLNHSTCLVHRCFRQLDTNVRNIVGLPYLSQPTWWELWSVTRIRDNTGKLEILHDPQSYRVVSLKFPFKRCVVVDCARNM